MGDVYQDVDSMAAVLVNHDPDDDTVLLVSPHLDNPGRAGPSPKL